MEKAIERTDPRREKVERVDAIVENGLNIIETLLTIAKAIPVVGGICGVAKEILVDVRKYKDKADDVAQAGRRVLGVLEFLRLLASRVDKLAPESTREVRAAMEAIKQLLEEFKAAVKEFGKPDFFIKAWTLRRYAGTLSRLDEKMRDELDFLTKAYGLARDENVEGLLEDITYKLEEALQKYVDARDDDKALEDAAEEGGVDPKEATTALKELHRKMDELNFQIEELIAEFTLALERSDDAAVQNVDDKLSQLMAETSSRRVRKKCLVLQLLVASFAGDTKTIEALIEETPTIIHEQLSKVGGACWALSALHISALCGNLMAIQTLKNMNGDFTIADAHKRTPLHHAAARGHVKVVSYLLRHCGVDVDAVDRRDRTPLMRASYEGFIDVVEKLVNLGKADVNAGFDDDDGIQTAVDIALYRDFTENKIIVDSSPTKPIPTKPTELQRSRGVGNLDAGHLVRLPTTGRPVFEVVDFIARGAHGEVYAVRSTSRTLGKFAMKRVRSDDDKLRGASVAVKKNITSKELRLCREALLMAELGTHPHIVSLQYCVVSGQNAEFLIFMTLVDACNLERLASSGDLYEGDTRSVQASILSILRELASALAFCHSRGVLHQDVKLENVLIDTAGRAYLGDFGLASHGEGVDAELRAPFEGCTLPYASPEVAAAWSRQAREVVLPRVSPAETDIWAFGIVALHLYYADEERFPEMRTALEGIVRMQPPDQCLAADVTQRPTALEASVANGGDAAECYALIASAQLRDGRCEEALVACDRALSNDEAHGSALFVKAEATYRLDSSESFFVDVIRRARLYDAELFHAPRAVEGAIAYLEAAKDEADSARDPVTNDRVSVSACVRDLPPNIVHRCDVKTEFGRAFPSTTMECWSVRGALADVLHTEAVEAAMRTGRVVIEGDACSGKGWILRAFVVALCEQQLDNGSDESSDSEFVLPLTIPLSSIENPEMDWLGGAIDSVRDGGDALRAARIDQRLVLCLDGLDEVSPVTRPSLVEKIVEYARGCPLTVITSRPAAANVGDLAPHGFAFLSVAQVDRRRVEDLGIPPDFASLVETPLSLRLVLLALSSIGELQTPLVLRHRSDLFRVANEEFVARAVAPTRRDGALVVARDVLRECGSSKVRQLFEQLALAAHEDRRKLIKRADLKGLASQRLAAAVWCLARSGLLPPFVPRGSSSVAYFHLTFQEYYVARILGSNNLLVGDRFDLGNPWWQTSALFAFQFAEPRERERALDALSRKIPALRIGDMVEVYLEKFRSYSPHTVFSLDGFVSNRKIGVKMYSWYETEEVSIERFDEECLVLQPAAQFGFIECVRVLIENGADVDKATTDNGATPLLVAALNGHVNCVRLLIVNGADVDKATTDIGATPLLMASQNGDVDCVRVLIEMGADVDKATTDIGATPLLVASHNGHVDCVRVLIEKGADVDNATTDDGATPLHVASLNGHVDCVRLLIENGADVDKAITNDGVTPLSVASRNGHVDCVRMLIEKGADVDKSTTNNGTTPLYVASHNGHVDCVRVLIENGADVDKARTDDGATPLYMASRNGHVDCVRVLIENGADVDKARTNDGTTPLYMASRNGHVDCVRMLIEKGADVDKSTTNNGTTPLSAASQNGHVDCVRVLIENGADVVKATTDDGATPLYVASHNGHVDCVRVLIENGADVDKAKTEIGVTPLFVASLNGHVDCVRVLIEKGADVDKATTNNGTTPLSVASHNGHVDCVRVLIEKGADVDKATTNNVTTPLSVASQKGHVDCVRVLIENGADVDKATTDDGATPLYVASQNDHVGCVRVLIENGADVDKARTNDGTTPLSMASHNGHVDCVRVLIENGADVDKARTDDGTTPLHMASQNGHVDCVRVLIENGADVNKATTDIGATPLLVASHNGHVDCVRVLIEKGADVDKAKTDNGMTPLSAASHNGHVDCVRVLIEKGADVDNATTDDGATPLLVASLNGHVDCVRLLIENGADVDKATTDDGATPLLVASLNGHVDCVRLLIEKGADVDKATTDDGATPLLVASLNGHIDCVRVLIENGADVDKARTNDGATPLYVASQNGHVGCVRVLIENCADVDKATTDDGATPLYVASQNGHVGCVRVLIENCADVDKATTDDGATPLYVAN
ncbi:hypothetical protein CTAYLR_003449 [Chrysophaeum taylorii]|uniref:Protein kinase domain-containing protein n=1 Tax=Chrysophaeum taylorii TaxID=2483200 RepID=A0AAD7U9Y7_9STRA|nr:hypothetical protein CTAYLR_003449 [Chrysophaeum taylorii]